jgi:hypothetical protein
MCSKFISSAKPTSHVLEAVHDRQFSARTNEAEGHRIAQMMAERLARNSETAHRDFEGPNCSVFVQLFRESHSDMVLDLGKCTSRRSKYRHVPSTLGDSEVLFGVNLDVNAIHFCTFQIAL